MILSDQLVERYTHLSVKGQPIFNLKQNWPRHFTYGGLLKPCNTTHAFVPSNRSHNASIPPNHVEDMTVKGFPTLKRCYVWESQWKLLELTLIKSFRLVRLKIGELCIAMDELNIQKSNNNLFWKSDSRLGEQNSLNHSILNVLIWSHLNV